MGAALKYLGEGDVSSDEVNLAAAGDAIGSGTDAPHARQVWYAHIVKLGERKLWVRLLEWLTIFDGMFKLVDSPSVLQEYAGRVFTEPDRYPIHKYAVEVLLPLLAQEYERRQAAREERAEDL